MKKKIITGAMTVFIMISSMASFAQQDKKVEKARKNVSDAKKDLKAAKIDSIADYEKFVTQANMSISENKKVIAGLKLKEISNNKIERESYNNKVLALEMKNDVLEKRIKNAQHSNTNLWERFKLNFNRDMQKLGEDLKRI